MQIGTPLLPAALLEVLLQHCPRRVTQSSFASPFGQAFDAVLQLRHRHRGKQQRMRRLAIQPGQPPASGCARINSDRTWVSRTIIQAVRPAGPFLCAVGIPVQVRITPQNDGGSGGPARLADWAASVLGAYLLLHRAAVLGSFNAQLRFERVV